MADEVDIANGKMEDHINLSVKQASRSGPELPRTGFCHWCEEPVEGVFCDINCSRDYEKFKGGNK